jgi:hypothetical protein
MQRLCDTRRGLNYGLEHPYAIIQLWVYHLLINYYICFNGDLSSRANIFAYPLPSIDECLHLKKIII